MAINESDDYKEDLSKEVRKIKRLLRACSFEELDRYGFKLEKFLFVSSFLIRKLLESKKLSDEAEKDAVRLAEMRSVTIFALTVSWACHRPHLKKARAEKATESAAFSEGILSTTLLPIVDKFRTANWKRIKSELQFSGILEMFPSMSFQN